MPLHGQQRKSQSFHPQFLFLCSLSYLRRNRNRNGNRVSLFAGSRRHGRGWHRTLGRGNSVRGYNRSRLLPLQHETTDGSLATANQLRGWSTVGKRKKGSNSVSNETIVAAASVSKCSSS